VVFKLDTAMQDHLEISLREQIIWWLVEVFWKRGKKRFFSF